MAFLSSHLSVGIPHPGMDYEHVNILRLDTIFKDAIQSLVSGANIYVQRVVTVPYNLGGLPKLHKVLTYSGPKYCFIICDGILIGEGDKNPLHSQKSLLKTHISSRLLAGPLFF